MAFLSLILAHGNGDRLTAWDEKKATIILIPTAVDVAENRLLFSRYLKMEVF